MRGQANEGVECRPLLTPWASQSKKALHRPPGDRRGCSWSCTNHLRQTISGPGLSEGSRIGLQEPAAGQLACGAVAAKRLELKKVLSLCRTGHN